ncbi:hypothetical protein PTKIN_Ptkin13bG0126900 [Pterospermum kingtungense]
MDCASPILDIVTRLWDCGAKHVEGMRQLHKNLEDLEMAMDELEHLRNDVVERTEVSMQRPRERLLHQVEGWLGRVSTIEGQVTVLVREGKLELENKCLGCCPRNMRLTRKIRKKVMRKLEEVKELIEKGKFEAVAERLPRQMVSEWPVENTVGLDSMVETVWRNIENRDVGVIGLYGMGGVGKTTLLKKINNDFSVQSHGFDVVIWITISKLTDHEKFQEIVRKKLDIPDDIWNECSNEIDRASEILRFLRSKKFVLLLDDMQNGFDFNLTNMGIPIPDDQNQSKIIFTTRSDELCGHMRAQVRIKVECLPPDEALKLFSMTVGENILNSDPEIPRLAEIVATRCRGLPLALVTVGRAMASRKNPREWRHSIEVLHSHPSEFSGMGDHVFPLLKFSYDSLSSATAQKCFLYCSIFPENHMISVDELIDFWLGEGFLDGKLYGENSRDQGEFIIGTLKLACLLDGDESTEFVWMHDVIRDMALWLARDEEKNRNKVLVTRNGRLTDQEFTKWVDSSWVSSWGSSSRKIIDYPPSCPNLSTLLVRDSLLEEFPGGFFDFMSFLQVLDLSGNQGLVELPPEIGRLRALQYLNLSLTGIKKLPISLANLRNLRCLLLDYTMELKEIPRDVISCLPLLQVYSKINGVMEYFDEVKISADDEVAFLEVLENLGHLNKICITIFAAPSVERILNSSQLQRRIRKLTLIECRGLISLSPKAAFRNMKRLEIFRCCSLQELNIPGPRWQHFDNLRQVYLSVCPLLLNLNCLAYAGKLQILTILDCESMEQVISESSDSTMQGELFPKLKTISLTRLRSLKSICKSSRCFSSLLEIEVSQCPCLKQLPFDSETANFLKKIRGETEWWEGLNWDSDIVKDISSLKFISTSVLPGKLQEQNTSTRKGKHFGSTSK